jgi:hypothetical protein
MRIPATNFSSKRKGKGAEQLTLKLVYARAFDKSPGSNSVQFDAPQAPVNRWEIRVSQSGVKVNVHPRLSATENSAETGSEKPEDKQETVVEAFVGAADVVRIDWTPKAEGAAGLTALTTVQARQEVTIDERVVRTRATLIYEISRADLSKLQIAAPAVFVSGAALQQGEIMVRRSPRLELRTEMAQGLVRADSDNRLTETVQAADADDPSILLLRPYQVYRFVRSGSGDRFTLRLNAAEARSPRRLRFVRSCGSPIGASHSKRASAFARRGSHSTAWTCSCPQGLSSNNSCRRN